MRVDVCSAQSWRQALPARDWETGVSWKMRTLGRNTEAAQRALELKIKPMYPGSSQFDVLAIFLNDYVAENFLSTRMVMEVSGPLVP